MSSPDREREGGGINIYIILHLVRVFKMLSCNSFWVLSSAKCPRLSGNVVGVRISGTNTLKCKNILQFVLRVWLNLHNYTTQRGSRGGASDYIIYLQMIHFSCYDSCFFPPSMMSFGGRATRCKKISNDELWWHHNRKFSSSCYGVSCRFHEFSVAPSFFKLPSVVGSPGWRLSAVL